MLDLCDIVPGGNGEEFPINVARLHEADLVDWLTFLIAKDEAADS
jgi:hypothetical protein